MQTVHFYKDGKKFPQTAQSVTVDRGKKDLTMHTVTTDGKTYVRKIGSGFFDRADIFDERGRLTETIEK